MWQKCDEKSGIYLKYIQIFAIETKQIIIII